MKHIALTILTLGFAVIFSIGPIGAVAQIDVCTNVTNGVFLANLYNCSEYIVCWNGVSNNGSCPEGLFFSAQNQSCDTAANTQCVQQCNSTLLTFSYDRTCTKYVLCFDGIPLVQSCCDNLQYNSANDRCDQPKNVDCVSNLCNSVNDPNNIVYLPSQASCQSYYICYNGNAYKKECATGLVFNTNKNCCDYKANFNCTDPPKRRSMLPYAKMPPNRSNYPCPKEGSHFFPHATDPTSYNLCLNGKGVVLTCAPGLVYDHTMEGCRDPNMLK